MLQVTGLGKKRQDATDIATVRMRETEDSMLRSVSARPLVTPG